MIDSFFVIRYPVQMKKVKTSRVNTKTVALDQKIRGSLTVNGWMIAVIPRTRVELATVLPRIFPITNPLWRRMAAEMEVVNSGSEVLKATAKIPKRIIGMPRRRASFSLAETITWALATRTASPAPNRASSLQSGLSVRWSVVTLWYSRLWKIRLYI